MFVKRILFLAIVFLTAVSANAQFGKNKVQYKIFDWQFIQSKHFDIYFSQGGYDIAQYTAVVAESSLVSLSKNLDYNISNRIPIIVFNSHNEFQQNNVLDEFLPEGVGGVTELFKNRILVPFEGNYDQFRHVIHHELLHGFMNDMFYGGSLQNIISRNITLAFPDWYSEGMAEVQSLNGLDKATDMYIRDAVLNNYLPPIEYINGYMSYRGGQSFFAWLNETYGEKLGELMNNIRAMGDLDFAFRETYKLPLEKLSEKWQKDLKKIHWPEIASREEVREFAKILTDHTKDGGFYNVAPVISPKGDKFAFISNRDDLFDVFIADINTGEIIEKVVEGNITNNFEELQILTPGLSWSPDGKNLAISVKAGDKDAIFIIDPKNGEKKMLPIKLNSISSVNWSSDRNKLAFIGSSPKQSDVYVYDIKLNKLANLTDDIFSDFNPTWTRDGKKIVFTSDRAAYVSKELIPPDFKMYNYNPGTSRDVYTIDIETGKIERITESKDVKHGYVQFNQEGDKALYVTDKNGISNLYVAERDSAGTFTDRPLTNSLNPIDQISLSKDGKKLLFVSLNEGGYDIFSLDNPFDKKIPFDTLPLTAFAQRKLTQEKRLIAKQSVIDSGRKFTPADTLFSGKDSLAKPDDSLLVIYDSLINAGDSLNAGKILVVKKTAGDSTNTLTVNDGKEKVKIYGSNIKVKFENDKGDKKIDDFHTEYDSSYSLNKSFSIEDNVNEDGSYKANKYKIKFSPDLVYGNAIYNSYYGVQGIAQISLSDVLGNHRITIQTSMVIDLKNSDYAFAYQYLPKRIDYGFALYHTARFITFNNGFGYNNLYRYRTIGGLINLSYPLTRYKRLEGGLSLMRISRENMDETSEPMTTQYLAIPSVSYIFDNTTWGFLAPDKGTRMNFSLMSSPKFFDNGLEFNSITGDIRKYFKIADDYSFVMRLSGGVSFGRNPQKFYLGGVDNWINWDFENNVIPFGESIESYAFSTTVTPMRGYNFNKMTGTKYLLTNLELRFPLLRYLIFGALPVGFANVMGNIFIDVGTAWNDTKKLQLIGRDDHGLAYAKDMLIATGVGSRIVMFGFPFRFDVAWNYDFRKFSAPKYYFALGLDF
ncbi:MAG: biopolymer transporter Tol [Ignavibacteriae bacterium]|jgi:Tol biopolymer transport system component|nr:biopolymer transporter Tol [Ignavibacteriota bacterium]